MKRTLLPFALAVLTIGLLGSCSKIEDRIDNLEKKVDGIENNQIASIEQQISAINQSITDLKAADETINGKIGDLKTAAEAQQTLIDALKEADKVLGQKDDALEARIATLEGQVGVINGQIKTLEDADKAINTKIDELKTYVDTELGKTKDWATETFATLTQYQQTADDLAALSVTVTGISTTLAGVQTSISGLDTKIDGIDAALQSKITEAKTELEGKISDLKTELEGKIAQAISTSEASVKAWINELLEGYYTAAEVEAKISALNTVIEAAKDNANERIDSVATELTTLKTAVDTAKANIRTEYRNAISTAINKFDGEIRGALKDSILSVNGRIEALDTRVTALEGRIQAVEGKVDDILAMIQSVSITPAYSDGSVEAVNGILTLKCIVKPAEALSGIESLKDSLLIYADSVKVKTKAASAYMEIKVSEATVTDAKQGAISLKADISEYLPEGADKALTVALSVRNGISDFTTEFVGVTTVIVPTFKAVYDTNDGANILTFYYDAVDHSGEGIAVYEGSTGDYYLFDVTKTSVKLWGYNGNRGNIKSVVIDASVAGYSGLTSTAYMFQGMTAATTITGAEYLDVSNVTDMSLMFQNFGSGSVNSHTTLNSVPDVSNWNTSNVTNMLGMFNSYGNFSDYLNKVPDVSNWNTSNVTNMSNMFQKYGYSSTTLSTVPDVSKWNTGNVKSMNLMFSGYGLASTGLNAVPDVSGWKTDNVTEMSGMFKEYGEKSTVLNVVPDVSGWNTGKVTSMADMFNQYGYSSPALTKVPDVSGWSTAKLTNLVNMFKDYGGLKTGATTVESNVEFTLDLSGWDLTNLTSGGSVFDLKPKTFNVTIPAQTGEQANTTDKWYYGDDTGYIAPPSGKTFTLPAPAGALKGEFSVSATKKVHFSQGNLVATINDSGAPTAWKFAAHQYDYLGENEANKTIGIAAGDVDLFGWSTAASKYGISTSTSSSDYSGDFVDWGKNIGDGSTWRTLSKDECTYLFNTTSRMVNSKPCYSNAVSGVSIGGTTYKGVFIYPDNYNGNEVSSSMTWDQINAAGIVFLPAAGYRDGSNVGYVGDFGYYWSSTALGSNYAFSVGFNSSEVSPGNDDHRDFGFSVRLITDVK